MKVYSIYVRGSSRGGHGEGDIYHAEYVTDGLYGIGKNITPVFASRAAAERYIKAQQNGENKWSFYEAAIFEQDFIEGELP